MFFKRKLFVEVLSFFGLKSLKAGGPKGGGHLKSAVALHLGTRLARAAKRQTFHIWTPPNVGLTAGLLATGTAIHGAVTLDATLQTTVTTAFTQPDVARNIQFVSNHAGLGDASWTGAIATVYGANAWGEPIIESVALDGTSAVNTIQAFASVSKLVLPPRDSSGATLTAKMGPALGFPCGVQAAGDLIAAARKAGAAVGYSQEALPGTVDVGEGYGPCHAEIKSTDTAVTIATADLVGSLPAAPFLLEIVPAAAIPSADEVGPTELVTVSAKSTSMGIITLTVKRNFHGSVAAHYNKGTVIAWRPGMTASPTITANDRIGIAFLTAEV